MKSFGKNAETVKGLNDSSQKNCVIFVCVQINANSVSILKRYICSIIQINKTVLLRERKRHTARHVASTPYTGPAKVVAQVQGTLAGGYLPWPGDTYLGRGYIPWLGVPTLAGWYVPWLGHTYLGWGRGIPTLAWGYLPWKGLPPAKVGTP